MQGQVMVRLTDKALERLRVRPRDYVLWDSRTTGLGIKITPAARRIWVLQLIYPGRTIQTKRTLGAYPGLSLAAARDKAAAWYSAVKQGIDPHDLEAKQRREAEARRAAEAQKMANTFAAVAERYISEHVHGQRRAVMTAREIRTLLVQAWADKPIASITPTDVKLLVGKLKARTPYQARSAYSHLSTLFRWATFHDLVEVSPCASLSPRWLFSGADFAPRQRVLSEEELFAFWRAAGRLGSPSEQFFRLLLLTGVRLNELAKARWSELHPVLRQAVRERTPLANLPDLAKTWVIPRQRFKSDAEHVVPLCDDALAILQSLPQKGDFLFSIDGRGPARFGSAHKNRLDARMLRTLGALARRRGEDPRIFKLERWTNHDLRRVVRSHLSALNVPDHVSEMCLGHGRKGLQRVYDQHRYEPQIREALTRWAARLHTIILPARLPVKHNVLTLRRESTGP
jgi:integrase